METRASRRVDGRVRRGGVSGNVCGAANRRPTCARACDADAHTAAVVLNSTVVAARGFFLEAANANGRQSRCRCAKTRDRLARKSAPCFVRKSSLSPARRGMQTYDAFAARVSARGDGGGDARAIGSSGDRSSNPRPSTSRDAALLATLPECYDAYVALHRGGLWFDINPFWHPELRCYYFRCEPNRTTISTHAARDPPAIGDASGDASVGGVEAENVATRKPQLRRRAVIVPVAVSRGSVSHRELRRVARLGDEWARETEQNEHERDERDERGESGRVTSDAPSVRGCREPADGETDDRSNVAREPTDESTASGFDGFRGDDPPAITTSLCVVDTDGVAVVLRVARGLVEPEEVDLPPKEEGDADGAFADGAYAEDAGERDPTSASGAIADRGASGFSDDEDDLDERDAGDVGVPEESRGK